MPLARSDAWNLLHALDLDLERHHNAISTLLQSRSEAITGGFEGYLLFQFGPELQREHLWLSQACQSATDVTVPSDSPEVAMMKDAVLRTISSYITLVEEALGVQKPDFDTSTRR